MSHELMSDDAMNVKVDMPTVEFTQRKKYGHFEVEYAFVDIDIIFHFFLSKGEHPPDFWDRTFPLALSDTAEVTFNATYPRLKAARTQLESRDPQNPEAPSLDSWWMKATGFAVGVGPASLCARFFERLEQVLAGP